MPIPLKVRKAYTEVGIMLLNLLRKGGYYFISL
jgi:hypothetical protein